MTLSQCDDKPNVNDVSPRGRELRLMLHHSGALARLAGITGLVLMSSLCVYGQKPSSEPPQTAPLRQNAILLLDSTIDDLAAVEDVETRVTFAADILRLLGGVKPERCRQMLDSLFDDLIELKGAKSSLGDARRSSPDASMRKLIQAAAAFDRKLARSYIDRYAREDSAQKPERTATAQSLAPAADLHMQLALQLIETDPSLAVRAAERAVAMAVTARTLEFLGTLRKKDVSLADAFFNAALRSVQARQGADINELLLLHTYVFSPTRVLWLAPHGIVLRQIPGYQKVAQNYPVNPGMAQQFLQASARILLADTQNRQGQPGSAAGLSGDLHFINLIKPLAARYAPNLFAPLSERGSLLVSYLQPEQHSGLQSGVESLGGAGNGTADGSENNVSTVESLLKRADALPPSGKRDYLYYTAAMTAVREKQLDAASDIAERVSTESRARVRDFIGFSIARQSVSERQLERAEHWARRDVDPVRRAYLFTLIADALLNDDGKDYARASNLLAEAEELASKLDAAREGFSVLLRGAEIYSRFDTLRASETLQRAFKAAGRNEGFSGGGKVSRQLEVGGFSFFYQMFDDQQSLSRALSRLAFSDYYGTLATIRELQNRTLRLRAVISLCGGVLAAESPDRPVGDDSVATIDLPPAKP